MGATTRRKVLLGALLWALVAGGAAVAIARLPDAQRIRLEHVKLEMWRALLESPPTFHADFAHDTVLERGNGVMAIVDGRLQRVGEVVRVRPDPVARSVRVTFALDDRREGLATFRPAAGSVAVSRSQATSLVFAAKKLLPLERRARIEQEWEAFRSRHAAAWARELGPLTLDLARGALRAIADELPSVAARHQRELDRLGDALQGELAGRPIAELLAAELWPILERHGAAPAEAIGRELWERVPLMSFALRAAADRVLDDGPVRVEERWKRFLEEEALPVLRQQRGAMESALASVAREALADPELKSGLAAILRQVQDDPVVQALLRRMLRELVTENPRLEAWLSQLPNDPALQPRFARLSAQLQEFLDPIGNLLFLDASRQGINPDLAELIRLLLLKRDANLLHLEGATGEPLADGAVLTGRHEF
ncbi:MAG: hypothetical protein FJ293_13140 [Planctomycetes bacterium]|nr:hypothetical protein [Planctomycetota bacterium]